MPSIHLCHQSVNCAILCQIWLALWYDEPCLSFWCPLNFSIHPFQGISKFGKRFFLSEECKLEPTTTATTTISSSIPPSTTTTTKTIQYQQTPQQKTNYRCKCNNHNIESINHNNNNSTVTKTTTVIIQLRQMTSLMTLTSHHEIPHYSPRTMQAGWILISGFLPTFSSFIH